MAFQSDLESALGTPLGTAIYLIVKGWEERNPGWKTTKADYRFAKAIWNDCGRDLAAVDGMLDAAIRRCDTDPFWAKNRTLRFVASRVGELLNQEDEGHDSEWEHEEWVRTVGINLFRLDDRERPVRLGRQLLGSWRALRAALTAIHAASPDLRDDGLAGAIQEHSLRDAGARGDAG